MTTSPLSHNSTYFSTRNCLVVIVLTTLLVFCRLMWADFTWWDDPHTVHHNPQLNPVKPETFAYYWKNPAANIYIPVTYTVWALLTFVARVSPGEFGISLNPWIYHSANIAFHAGAAAMAFMLVRLLLKDNRAALVGGLLFSVHPVQVESVAWISGLKDVLAGALTLTSLWQYAASRIAEDSKRRQIHFILSITFYVLAMLAKPSAMTTPLLICVLEWVFSKTTQAPAAAAITSWKWRSLRLFPYFLLVIPIAYVARSIQQGFVTVSPIWARPLVVLDSLAFYIGKVIAPLHLCADYGRNPLRIIETGQIWYTWIATALVIIICLFLAMRRVIWPLAGFAVFAFAPFHVLGLTTFDFQGFSTTADHYLYVAILGPALIAAWLVKKWPWPIFPIAVLAILILGCRSVLQTGVWHDDLTMIQHTMRINPRTTFVTNLSAYYSRIHQVDLALEYANIAKEREPKNPLVYSNSAIIHMELGNREAASKDLEKLIQLYQSHYGVGTIPTITAFIQAADLYLAVGDLDRADKMLSRAREIKFDHPSVVRFEPRIRAAKSRG